MVRFILRRLTIEKFWARSWRELSQILTEELLILGTWECLFISHPPHGLSSPVELHLRVGPRTLSEKIELREQGMKNFLCLSVCL